MLVLLLLAALLLVLCCVLGQGLTSLCGWREWRWWSPAVGLAILLVIGGQVIRVPGHATTAAIATGLLALLALFVPGNLRALRAAAPEGLPLALFVLLLACIPFFASGRAGVLGVTLSDDMSQHLTGAWWIRTRDSPLLPAAAIGGNLIRTGYPLGPHGIAAALTAGTGAGEVRAFSALTVLPSVLAALAALGGLPRAPRLGRWGAAVAIGICYLMAAYLGQGLAKEVIEGAFVLAVAVILMDLLRAERAGVWRSLRRGVPLGVVTAGAVYTYSYGGIAWEFGAVGILTVLELLRLRRRFVAEYLRRMWAPVAGGLLALAVVAVPEKDRMVAFSNSVFGVEPKTNQGNLPHAVNPFEALGVWLSGDFRRATSPLWPSVALQVLAALALLAGFAWWWRRGRLAPPATFIAAALIWGHLAITRNIYNAAKGLIVVAPIAAFCLAVPLLAAWGVRRTAGARGGLVVVARATGAVLLVFGLISSFLVLRSTQVGLGPAEAALNSFRPLIGRDTVLFLPTDHFAQWEVRGTHVFSSAGLYLPARQRKRPEKPGGRTVDVDNYTRRALDRMQWLITSDARFQSSVPDNFRLVRVADKFRLYRRLGPSPPRGIVERDDFPSGLLDCRTGRGRAAVARYRTAGEIPPPFLSGTWRGSIARPGGTATMRVPLGRGRWDVSLQYLSPTPVDVRGPGLRYTLPVWLGRVAPFWYAGTLTSRGGQVTLRVTSRHRNWFGRLIGTRPLRAQGNPTHEPLWHAAFTRHGARPRLVPATAACGRWVDWLTDPRS